MFLVSLLSRLPLRVLYAFADILAFIAYRVVRYRLRVVKYNIDLCFPELSHKERQAIVRDYYRHFADVIVETIWFGGCTKERIRDQRIVEHLNPEIFEEMSGDGRSMVILSSHFGNWELVGGLLNYNYTDRPLLPTEKDVVVVYKKLRSQKWNMFFHHNRTAVLDDPLHFEGYLETKEVLRYVVRHRREQKYYIFITDQRPYRSAKGSLPVTFLGQSCQTMAAAANLAQQFGYGVVYQRMRWLSRGHYTYDYIPITQDASTVTAQEIMDRYYELLSEDVKAQPEQYLWSHRRFKNSTTNRNSVN